MSQASKSKFRYHIIETIQRLMSSNRKIPKKLEAQLLKVLHEEEAKGEKEGLLSNQEIGNAGGNTVENPFEQKAHELVAKF